MVIDDGPGGEEVRMMRDDDDLLTIGEVAKLDGTSTKAMRYYDAHGILTPVSTDERTGYRYYAPDQLLEMDVIRLCLDAGVPLSSLETFRRSDGTLDWRGVMETGRTRVRREMARLRNLEVSLDDYLNEVTRKARMPGDGVVRSDLPSTWMVGRPWPHAECAFALKPYLRAMAALRAAVRAAGLPRLLRRGILLDRREGRAYAYQQFDPEAARCDATAGGVTTTDDATTTGDAADRTGDGPFGFDASLAVFHPAGGYGEGRVIERESLSACFDEAFATAARDDPDEWPHATICEIWGSHTADGTVRVRLTRHRCDAGRV